MDFGITVLFTLVAIAICLWVGSIVGRQQQSATLVDLRLELAESYKRISGLENVKDHLSSCLDGCQGDYDELWEKDQARIAALEADKKHLEHRTTLMDGDLAAALMELNEARQNLEEYSDQMTELNTVIQKKHEECDSLREKLNKEYTDRRYYQDRCAHLGMSISKMGKSIEGLSEKVKERDAVIKGLQSKSAILTKPDGTPITGIIYTVSTEYIEE
ncbi:hypothetical protein [Bremerella sp. P1]|uniref:hypothetical protein n=1 Tax=Bremerella sp. P1 TaxID=3026424 RepID=UPI0023677E45|nr:hypothetical protein [Bremerella sp. P1]WDI44790.1 hypothetical protein PSR63_12675 [Bremerella sp. P1]